MKNLYKLNLSKYSTHNIIRKNIGFNNNVLDVGCNEGYIGKASGHLNCFYGIDSCVSSIKKAKKIYKDAIVYNLDTLNKLPWNIKFDILIFADVLEHVISPSRVLDFFVKNYLKDDGSIIISLPNVANWQLRLSLMFGKFDYVETGILDKTHLHLYTFKSAKKLVRYSGLKIEKIFGGASFFGPIIKKFPFLKTIFATNIIVIAKK